MINREELRELDERTVMILLDGSSLSYEIMAVGAITESK